MKRPMKSSTTLISIKPFLMSVPMRSNARRRRGQSRV
jgi:hypothetical protein